MAVETNLIDIIRSGFALLADDGTIEAMASDPDHCAIIAAALADAHAKLDLMIYLSACEIAGARSQSRGFEPNFGATSSRHTPQTCWRSFRRVVTRFDDRERPAHLRAVRLVRERDLSPVARPSNHRKPTLNTPKAQLPGTRPYAHPPHGLPASILVYRPNTTDHSQKG